MRSLRSRLILGTCLIAVIPLAVAMALLSRRIEQTVRTQASTRLSASIGALQAELAQDAQRAADKLDLLAKDPALRRLYLVRPTGSRDLADYLAERRFLLGLDFLQVADTSGVVVADGSAGATGDGVTWRIAAGGAAADAPVAIRGIENGIGLAMSATAPIRYENAITGTVRGGILLDAPFLARLEQTSGVEFVLRDAGGVDAASTLTEGLPRPAADGQRVVVAGNAYIVGHAPLEIGPLPHASIVGLVPTASADQTIRALQITSLLLGLLGLGIAILLGVLWSSQISRPVERLADFSQRVAHGEWDEPLTLRSVRELETLGTALDRMRRDLTAYRARLVVSERQAAWSQMARRVAHEIKNPLTPIAVSVADLKRSYELQRPDFPQILDLAVRTIANEIETLKHLLQEFSDFGRLPPPEIAPCRLPSLLVDLETLYGRDVAERRLSFAPSADVTFPADPGQMRQALVNLIKNGLEAVGDRGAVAVSSRVVDSCVEIAVADDGDGLDAAQRAQLFTPGFTTKTHGSGLGLTMVQRIVHDHGGTVTVDDGSRRGTTFRIRVPLVAAMPARRADGEA
jgi:two-component system nitrogen regulation sensor histidine kinase NtrY